MSLIISLLLLLTTVTAVAVGALYIFFKIRYQYWGKRKVPHSNPRFPFGDLGGIGSVNLGVIFKQLYDQGAGHQVFGMWTLGKPNLLVRDPELVKNVMVRDFMHFHDHDVYVNEEEDPLAAHLFNIKGTAWRNIRAKLTPTFTSGKMKMMFPLMKDIAKDLEALVRAPAQRGEVVEVKEIVARFTTDVIASCAFGIQANSLKDPEAMFRKMGRNLFEPTWGTLLRNGITFLAPDLAEFLKLINTRKDVEQFFLGAFKDTVEHRENNNIERKDFLQLLIQLKNKGIIDDVDNSKKDLNEKDKFTMEQAAAQAFVFFIGGFETSSTAMQFMLYEMALQPDIQEKARQEVKQVLAKHGGEMSYEAVYEMEYLGRVVDETLRKYPPAPVLTRKCTKEYKMPGSDLIIEKGTGINIPIYGMHMDPMHFPDPEKFDPDRFTEEQKATRHNYTFLPFGEGPRVCIGQRFGLMQMKVAMTTLLSNFKFEVCKETHIPMKFDAKVPMFSPEGGMNLRVTTL